MSNYTPEELRQAADAFEAHEAGKVIQFKWSGDERWLDIPGNKEINGIGFNGFLKQRKLYRPKPEPKVRPWTADEVPVGKVVRRKDSNSRFMITGVDPVGDVFLGGAGRVTCVVLFEYYIQANESPCGVQE